MRIITQWKEVRRRRAFEAELVAGLTFINNALRAGLGLAQAIALLSEETNGAFASEMKWITERQKVGVSLTNALVESARTTAVPDWQMTVHACLILLETGGNLIESFQLILETIRDRQRVVSKMRTVTAQGRAQAIIISAMPFGIAGLLASFSPDYIDPLVTTPMGWGICAMGVLLMAGGLVWMRFILDVEV
ncbi:MAG: hypothetical protein COV45_06970 [Deltaproteobacteria bacterium CG11_big_fil_rev_8_21_14_0_20_47_16]|nr:MAG: hypothetical protein COV45_06970 [Deltaproteobacteria bacterium CG11_big_fil_rev_8_21_14_0_20_47_16]